MLGQPDQDYPIAGTVLDLIATSQSNTYLSWTEDVGDDELVVSAPKDSSLRPVAVQIGEQIDLVWSSSGELRCLPVVLASIDQGEQPRWRLRRVGVVKRGQRREAVRAPLTLPVELRAGPALFRATTVDLSEGGLRCVLAKERRSAADAGGATAGQVPPEPGDVVRMAAMLPDASITCVAEVARRHPRDDARVELSMRFIGLQEHQQDLIRKHVFTRLRELRQRGLL